MMLHVEDAVKQDFPKVKVRTVDTDVLMLSISVVHRIDNLEDCPWSRTVTTPSVRLIKVYCSNFRAATSSRSES